MDRAKITEAIEIANEYAWPEFPTLFADLERGHVPDGFGTLVGQTIALFMNRPPLGGLLQSPRKYQEMRDDDRRHGARLARLRMLVALIAMEERRNATA